MRRRKYLAAVGLALGTGIAGCGSGSDSNNSSSNGGGTLTDEANGTAASTATKASGDSATAAMPEGTSVGNSSNVTESTNTATVTERETAITSSVQSSTSVSAGGGGTGNTEVSDTELVVEEGEYSTDIYMTGIVENTGSGVLRLPEVRVSFYDDSDSILETSTESIVFLKPGRKWAINVPYLDDGEPARGEIESTSTEVFQTKLGIPDRLEIAAQELQTGEEPSLSVAVENTSNSAVAPAVFCVFYDGDGVALGDGLDSLDQLPAGETWQTSLDFFGYSTQDATQVSDYDLYANIT